MTAAAVAENLHPAVHAAPAAHAVSHSSTYEIQAAEQKRWMIWFGIPALVMSIFVGITLGTGDAWIIGLAIGALLVDIFVLIWLAMSSDTNGLIGEPPH